MDQLPPEPVEVDVPNTPIVAFHVTARDRKKARRMRAALAADAPAYIAVSFINTPIIAQPKIRKNRMYAIASDGTPILEINLKSGQLDFIDAAPVMP